MAQETKHATDIEKYLSDTDYPIEKQALIQRAKSMGAKGDVVSALNGLPNREFSSSEDVMGELTA